MKKFFLIIFFNLFLSASLNANILPNVSPEEQYKFATKFLKLGEYNDAEIALKEFINKNKDHSLTGNAQYWLGETFRIRQDYSKAKKEYINGYKNYSDSLKAPNGLWKLSTVMFKLNENANGCKVLYGLLAKYEKPYSVINSAKKDYRKYNCKSDLKEFISLTKSWGVKTQTVAKKPTSNHTKEDLRYTLLTYGLKIDNETFVFKFNKDESGLLKSKMNVWHTFTRNPDGSYGPAGYKEEITEDKIFWTIENENKFSFRKIGRDTKNFVVLDFKNRFAKVNLDKSNFEGKIWTPQEIVKAGTKEKQIAKKPKEKIIITPDIDSSLITIGSGSGFYINNQGYALTNNHVIDICKQSIAVIDGKETLFRVIATDKTNDVAVLKTDYKSRNFIKINEDGAKLGENVIAVGYPLAGRLSDSVKITRGIVSSLSGLDNNIGQIQIDAALQPGNSGGPVLNENGELVGIASAGLNKLLMAKEAKYIPENVNFAVASPIVVNILKSKKVKYTTPGMFGGSFSNTELAELGDSSTIQLFCRNTRAEYARLKKSKQYSQVLLDID